MMGATLQKTGRRQRRTRVVVVSLVIAVFAGPFVMMFLLTKLADQSLQSAMDEADRLDPDWRLEELEAKREVVPDSENSARQTTALSGKQWHSGDSWPTGE